MFPGAGWADFILRVLEQWAAEYARIWSGDGVARLMVFDGSDRMRLVCHGDALLVSIESGDGRAIEKRLGIEAVAEFGNSAASCCKAVLNSCSEPLTDEEVRRFQGVAAQFQPRVW